MSDSVDVTIPVGQAEGTESLVSMWFKAVGDEVTENEPLLEISTDKVNMEVAAPASGQLLEILKQEGEQVELGDVLGRIGVGVGVEAASGASGSGSADPSADIIGGSALSEEPGSVATAGSGMGGSTELSPAVRRLLAENDLDATQISGSGRGGRITHQDVLDFLADGVAGVANGVAGEAAAKSLGKDAPEGTDEGRVEGPRNEIGAADELDSGLVDGRGVGVVSSKGTATADQARQGARLTRSAIPGRMIPHSQMRRSIAQHMVNSVATAPHVTTVFEADLSRLVSHRQSHAPGFLLRGVKLTYTAYFVQAAVEALKHVPEANSRWQDDGLAVFDDINIGIATALGDGGLIVPVICQAQDLDLFGIAERLHDLTERARGATLDTRDVQNGTFTISNHGVSGSLVATPIIINQPQSAILGVGKMERRVVVDGTGSDERIVVKPMCFVTLTIDHRVLDGFLANRFLTKWVEVVEARG